MYKVTCSKCGGTGNVPCFNHIEGGLCYECKGAGFTMRKTKPVELIRFHVTAIIRDGYQNAGGRGGKYVEAKNENAALKKAKLSPDGYDLETLTAEVTK